jgi:lysophospholipase
MTEAPFFADIANAPAGAIAHWRTCKDGVRVRVVTWKNGTKGTVLIFPGRTEFIEKYGPTVQSLMDRGFSVAVIDWRGQGLSDRVAKNRQLGHVKHFLDYQMDVEEMLATVTDAGLPTPECLIAHSMGGSIGLRALHNGLTVKHVVFSAPMWGIYLPPILRIPAKLVSTIGPHIGFSSVFSPNTSGDNYVQVNPFAGNTLTNDQDTYEWLTSQLNAHPELGIGGPSINWLHQALMECAKLRRMPPPKHDCICILGSEEAIVSTKAIEHIMGRWHNGKLVNVAGAQHEIFMEEQHVLDLAWAEVDSLLAA